MPSRSFALFINERNQLDPECGRNTRLFILELDRFLKNLYYQSVVLIVDVK